MIIKLIWANHLGLTEDEAYYWLWSQQPDIGYFDHPPLIAWLIGAGVSNIEPSEFGVRWLPIFISTLALCTLFRQKKPDLGIWSLSMMPMFALGGLLSTPDSPLIAAWCLGIWAALYSRWRWFGVALGCALLSKYTGALLIIGVLLADPKCLKTKGPWEAMLIAGLIYLPNMIWNSHHDWVSYRFQLGHLGETAGQGNRLEFVLGQFIGGTVNAYCWDSLVMSPARTRQSRIVASCTALPLVIGAMGGEAIGPLQHMRHWHLHYLR